MIPQTKTESILQSATGFEVTEWQTLLTNLGVGLGLSLVMQWHFRTFGSTFSNRREFSRNFPLLMLTTIFVISVIKSSLALSLGLVGALSIVRFRTPIKEPEELAYLFLAIALGLGLGAELTGLTCIAAAAVLIPMGILSWARRERRGRSMFLSIEWPEAGAQAKPLDHVAAIIGEHAAGNDLRRIDAASDRLDATFYVDFASFDKVGDLVAHLNTGCPGAQITVIDQNRMPTV